ncbi:MAG: DUF362 domain-containing protein [Desulfobulbus sp.]|jgi:uncharacterized Fe-S center protein|uniref:DUF362 domain-containing protein n=1 Tax=Desulfobulbus sp. TaxID=895 RepID=UPI0028444716|nr:DUF362 domain-containing protein [Desulfobulbus sp.]MDR2550134.1 DUF362 domain-containing protein [Desulfobulbus sp.]
MAPATVYSMDLNAKRSQGILPRLRILMRKAGLEGIIAKDDLTAIKLHFGELGNTAFVRPLFVRPVVEAIKKAGGKPFLTDASTLYVGERGNAVDHLNTAVYNGFGYSSIGAPLIIADGLNGREEIEVPVESAHFKTAFIGAALMHAHALVSVAHFKLHEMAGFGGALKNVGMGGGSRRGKMAQHSTVSPVVAVEKCIGCGMCLPQCIHGALSLVERNAAEKAKAPNPKITRLARIDKEKCVGCAMCLHACKQGAIEVDWAGDIPAFLERMIDYAAAALYGKKEKSLFINFLTQISPACDCHSYADAPIVGDIGILASTDPVALDKASVDLMNRQPVLPTSCLAKKADTTDKIRAVYAHIPWEHQFAYAEKIGLGTTEYTLTAI